MSVRGRGRDSNRRRVSVSMTGRRRDSSRRRVSVRGREGGEPPVTSKRERRGGDEPPVANPSGVMVLYGVVKEGLGSVRISSS